MSVVTGSGSSNYWPILNKNICYCYYKYVSGTCWLLRCHSHWPHHESFLDWFVFHWWLPAVHHEYPLRTVLWPSGNSRDYLLRIAMVFSSTCSTGDHLLFHSGSFGYFLAQLNVYLKLKYMKLYEQHLWNEHLNN